MFRGVCVYRVGGVQVGGVQMLQGGIGSSVCIVGSRLVVCCKMLIHGAAACLCASVIKRRVKMTKAGSSVWPLCSQISCSMP